MRGRAALLHGRRRNCEPRDGAEFFSFLSLVTLTRKMMRSVRPVPIVAPETGRAFLSTIDQKLRTNMLCDILKMEIMRFTFYLLGVGNIPSKFKQKMSKNSDQLSTGYQQGV